MYCRISMARFVSIMIILILMISSKRNAFAVPNDWNHGCTKSYDKDGNLVWDTPKSAEEGDLLLLLLHRTDHYLPLKLDGWEYGASCFKNANGQKQCFTKRHCKQMKDEYCQWFPKGKGRDLATVIFFKTLEKKSSSLPRSFKYKIGGSNPQPGWGFLLAVKGVDKSDPVRGSSITSADNSAKSVFPSVHGKKGDLLLLSLAFDDKSNKSDFLPPAGTDLVNFVSGSDETGFLFSKQLSSNGDTGELKTKGNGGSENKDALISLVLESDKDQKARSKNLRKGSR